MTGRVSSGSSRTQAKGHCVSATLNRRCFSSKQGGAPKGLKYFFLPNRGAFKDYNYFITVALLRAFTVVFSSVLPDHTTPHRPCMSVASRDCHF